MILRDIARARENIQKSLAGVSTRRLALRAAALVPASMPGTAPALLMTKPLEQSQGETCGAIYVPTAREDVPPAPWRSSPPCCGCSWAGSPGHLIL